MARRLQATVVILASFAVGLVYGKLATVCHWYLPPNWLGRVTGADGEDALDAGYLSLYIDTSVVGFGVWNIRRLLARSPH